MSSAFYFKKDKTKTDKARKWKKKIIKHLRQLLLLCLKYSIIYKKKTKSMEFRLLLLIYSFYWKRVIFLCFVDHSNNENKKSNHDVTIDNIVPDQSDTVGRNQRMESAQVIVEGKFADWQIPIELEQWSQSKQFHNSFISIYVSRNMILKKFSN